MCRLPGLDLQTAGSSDVEEYEPDYDSDVEMDTEEEYAAKLAAAQQAQAARLRQGASDGAGPSGGACSQHACVEMLVGKFRRTCSPGVVQTSVRHVQLCRTCKSCPVCDLQLQLQHSLMARMTTTVPGSEATVHPALPQPLPSSCRTSTHSVRP